MIESMREGREIATETGRLVFSTTSAFDRESASKLAKSGL